MNGIDPNGLANVLFCLGRRVQAVLGPALPSLRPLPLAGLLGRSGEDEEEPVGRHRDDDYAWPVGASAMDDTRVVSAEEVASHGATRG